MIKCIKNPHVYEAIQVTKDNLQEIMEFMGQDRLDNTALYKGTYYTKGYLTKDENTGKVKLVNLFQSSVLYPGRYVLKIESKESSKDFINPRFTLLTKKEFESEFIKISKESVEKLINSL